MTGRRASASEADSASEDPESASEADSGSSKAVSESVSEAWRSFRYREATARIASEAFARGVRDTTARIAREAREEAQIETGESNNNSILNKRYPFAETSSSESELDEINSSSSRELRAKSCKFAEVESVSYSSEDEPSCSYLPAGYKRVSEKHTEGVTGEDTDVMKTRTLRGCRFCECPICNAFRFGLPCDYEPEELHPNIRYHDRPREFKITCQNCATISTVTYDFVENIRRRHCKCNCQQCGKPFPDIDTQNATLCNKCKMY